MVSRIVSAITRLLRPARRPAPLPGRVDAASGTATVAVDAPSAGDLVLSYTPRIDGDPDAGEIVWTWVPYAENDGRGKDRPVLVIAPHTRDRVYAVRLTSTPHDEAGYVALGTGEWDARGRPSWVDLRTLYSVHVRGMRREAAALDRARFDRVATALRRRYGWRAAS